MRELLTPPVPTALDVAVLCQQVSVTRAAALIEQYARTVASEVSLETATRMRDRINLALESPLCAK
jgi:hypothetical protein